jgi:electron transfer flavoprotein beta subunit
MSLDIAGATAKTSREIEGGKEFIEVDLPFVAGCQEPIAEWKIPNMRGIMTARSKPLRVVEPAMSENAGTSTVISYDDPPPKGSIKMIDAENAEELIDLLVNEAKVL